MILSQLNRKGQLTEQGLGEKKHSLLQAEMKRIRGDHAQSQTFAG